MKQLALILAALLLVAAVSFATGNQEAATGGKMTLTMYDYNERTNPVEGPNRDYVIKSFLAANPDIELKIEWGFTEPYHVKFRTMVAANQIPDLMFLWPDKRTAYVTGQGHGQGPEALPRGPREGVRALAPWRRRGPTARSTSCPSRSPTPTSCTSTRSCSRTWAWLVPQDPRRAAQARAGSSSPRA